MRSNLIFPSIICSALLIAGFETPISAAESASNEPEGMVYVPAGEFKAGLTAEQADRLCNEYHVHPSLLRNDQPQRTVNLDGFWIDRYEVTNAQYKEFVDATGTKPPYNWPNGVFPEGKEDEPVSGSDWDDAAAYAEWAGKRLPTADEWEKAARGTDGRIYPWGNEWRDGACQMDRSSKPGDPFGSVPVGSYPQDESPYGAMDMAGNVSEWTSDLVTKRPNTPFFWPDHRLFKGGNYTQSQPYSFRTTMHIGQPPINGIVESTGFRCVMDADQPPKDGSVASHTHIENASPAEPAEQLPAVNLEAYAREPIQVFPMTSGGIHIISPALPEDPIAFGILESIPGPAGTGSEYTFSDDHTHAVVEYSEDEDKPDRMAVKVELQTDVDYLDIEYYFENIGTEARSASISSCLNARESGNFRDHEGVRTYLAKQDGFVPINQIKHFHHDRILAQIQEPIDEKTPFYILASRDGEWVLSQTAAVSPVVFNNMEYSCQHAGPEFTLAPGESLSVKQRIYLMRGKPGDVVPRWQSDTASW